MAVVAQLLPSTTKSRQLLTFLMCEINEHLNVKTNMYEHHCDIDIAIISEYLMLAQTGHWSS